jgi:two-component system CheB/CheR fusion protein
VADPQAGETNEEFEAVLRHLKDRRGFDFTGYKRASLMRRVQRRMSQIGVDNYSDYIDHLQVNGDEFVALFNAILINVTAFFRDFEAWEFLQHRILPMMIGERGPEDPIRVWSAGCASGEEAYSLAILLAEALGADVFRRRVKIYATDVDEEALAQARHAVYTEREVQGVPAELLDRYFEPQGSRYAFRPDLRRSVIFGRNDLIQDAPISRIDLLVCRNTLMYFNAETQGKILERLHFALVPRGLMFLGKAEMLLSRGRLFDPVDLKRRIFRKLPTSANVPVGFAHTVLSDRRTDVGSVDELRELAFSASPVAQVVAVGDEILALANEQAQSLFGLSSKDVGRPLRDLEVFYRPAELRRHIDKVRAEGRATSIKDVEWQRGPGDVMWFEVHINPLFSGDGGLLGISVVFHDVTAAQQLLGELEHANRQLESAYEELQSTNEELETTNEELQSTVEELETTNEELQSTNEELETMNEELQSTNDELQTINDALRERSGELDDVNAFLESILASMRPGVVILDSQMRVLAWNRSSEELWGLRREEAEGDHLLNLDVGLPVAELRPVVRPALADRDFSTELTLRAVNRRGRQISVRVVCSSLRGNGTQSQGALLLMEQVEQQDPARRRQPTPG